MSLSVILYLAGMALVFAGQRLFGGGDALEWTLTGGGALAVLASLGLRLGARSGAPSERHASAHVKALLYGVVGAVSLAIYFLSTDAAVEALESSAMSNLVKAARFKGEQGEVEHALKLVDTALAMDENWYAMWAKAEILHGAEQHKDAMKVAKQAMELGEAADNFFWKARVEAALAEWPKK